MDAGVVVDGGLVDGEAAGFGRQGDFQADGAAVGLEGAGGEDVAAERRKSQSTSRSRMPKRRRTVWL